MKETGLSSSTLAAAERCEEDTENAVRDLEMASDGVSVLR